MKLLNLILLLPLGTFSMPTDKGNIAKPPDKPSTPCGKPGFPSCYPKAQSPGDSQNCVPTTRACGQAKSVGKKTKSGTESYEAMPGDTTKRDAVPATPCGKAGFPACLSDPAPANKAATKCDPKTRTNCGQAKSDRKGAGSRKESSDVQQRDAMPEYKPEANKNNPTPPKNVAAKPCGKPGLPSCYPDPNPGGHQQQCVPTTRKPCNQSKKSSDVQQRDAMPGGEPEANKNNPTPPKKVAAKPCGKPGLPACLSDPVHTGHRQQCVPTTRKPCNQSKKSSDVQQRDAMPKPLTKRYIEPQPGRLYSGRPAKFVYGSSRRQKCSDYYRLKKCV